MEEILEKIKSLSDDEVREVMRAFEKLFAVAYPEWDVFYVAIHKDLETRKQEFSSLLRFISKDIEWQERDLGNGVKW